MEKNQLSHRQLAQLCRGFSLLIHAGVSVGEGAFWLAREAAPEEASLLTQLGGQLEQGVDLARAMEESGAFPSQVTGLVRVGEASGRLEEALTALADYYDRRCRTARQIKNALSYPSLLFLLMLVVIGVLLIQVLPVFDDVYASLGSGLTGAAGVLLQLGYFLKEALPVLLAVLAVITLILLVPPLRRRGAALFLRCFGDRGIFRSLSNARFAQALAMGLRSGLSREESVALAAELLEDVPQAKARCASCLGREESMARAMEKARLLTPSQAGLLELGLRGGNADQVMENIAQTMDSDAREAVEDLVSRLEPAMVLICSVLVGVILLAVMLPLMNIMSTIG